MKVTIATCRDCGIDWELRCPVCKIEGFKTKHVWNGFKKIKEAKKKPSKTKYSPSGLFPIVDFKNTSFAAEFDLLDYFKEKHPKRVVSLIRKGHDAACACCYYLEDLTFDHIIPVSKGGPNRLSNGQILCVDCNTLKGDRIIEIIDLRKEI